MKKNILIVGNSAKESCLARILSEEFEVFVAPGNVGMKDFATLVDIRENNVIDASACKLRGRPFGSKDSYKRVKRRKDEER